MSIQIRSLVADLVCFFQRWRRCRINARDLKRINASADRLNAEAQDVLNYQYL